jgi:cytochrome bd-type quinol oxidase subunit 1
LNDFFFARSQMGMSLAFHIVFAVIGMAMPLLMAVSEGCYWGHSSIYKKLYAKGQKRLAPKWTQLAILEASVASPMIISGQVDVFPLQRGEVRK